ncbi:MAG: hypothetical protein WBQ64_20580 [Terriglobales bacterium]
MLPIYPWMAGRFFRPCSGMLSGDARSLMVAAIIGLVGVAGFIGLVLWTRSVWYGALSAFMLMNCWRGLKQAQALSRLAKLPRRNGLPALGATRRRPWESSGNAGSADIQSIRSKPRRPVRIVRLGIP